MKFLVYSILALFAIGEAVGQMVDYNTQIKNLPLKGGVIPQNWGAKGDNIHDDTSAVQSCIDSSAANRVTCMIPPGIYKITGSGLHMLTGFPSLWSFQSEGNAQPTLMYYGTGTALTIGNCTNRMFAINLTNIGIEAATGVTAAIGVDVCNFSGGDFNGLVIGGGATTGVFTKAMKLTDVGGLNMRRLILSNQIYTAGTTGILFNDFSSFGNSGITIDTSDQSNIETQFEFKSCQNCIFRDGYMENFDYALKVDNTIAFAASSTLDNIMFDGWNFNTSGAGPTHHKILQVNSTTGNFLSIVNMKLNNCFAFLSGGVTDPITLSVASTAVNSILSLNLTGNRFLGANNSVVNSNAAISDLFFENNYVRDNTGAIRTPNAVGTFTINNINARGTNNAQLEYSDIAGIHYASGYTSVGGTGVISRILKGTATLTIAAPLVVPGCTTVYNITVTGAQLGDLVFINPAIGTGFSSSAGVSGLNTVALQFCQFTGAPAVPALANTPFTAIVLHYN